MRVVKPHVHELPVDKESLIENQIPSGDHN